MSPEQGLAGRDGEDARQDLRREPALVHQQRAVHARPAQVGRVLGQVHVPQPLHHPAANKFVTVIETFERKQY